jgi:hypothetical protein
MKSMYIRGAAALLALASSLGPEWNCEAGDAAPVRGVVVADKLNVRVKPGLGKSVVASLARGDAVEARPMDDEWLEIAAPKNMAVWVATCFVADGVLKRNAKLRAGPGVAYESFGLAPSQEAVKPLDDAHQGWLRIEPPSWLRAYVSAKFVKLDSAAPKGHDEELSATQDSNSKKIVGDKSAGRGVMLEGTLLPVDDKRQTATHALASQVNGEYHTLCYLKGSNFNLHLWEGRKVRVKGEASWVGDWRRPLVEVEQITPVWQ